MRSVSLLETMIARVHRRLRTVTQAKTPEDIRDVAFDRGFPDKQAIRNLTVRGTRTHETEHLAFPPAQLRNGRSWLFREVDTGGESNVGYLALSALLR